MSKAERIEAAIEKLETLTQQASLGVMFLPIQDDPVEYDLGTTLYRTIDAQLAILREALFQIEIGNAGFIATELNLFMRLADAILGGDPSV